MIVLSALQDGGSLSSVGLGKMSTEPPGEVQAISGGAPPGVPCHLGLPRHHHWQRPTKVILYMETI